MNRIYSVDTVNKVGEEVLLKGWVNARRNMGKIAFLDLRDREGILQVVGVPSELDEKSNEELKRARLEYLLEIRGIVQERGAKQQNPDMPTGTIEILAKEIKIITESEPMPFEVSADTKIISEELRLKYRYLDLRSERMKNNLEIRHNINLFLRNYLSEQGFWEIETPSLTKGTPEGAREFLVPSRVYPGNFYVLPQSPQQFKQLLMVGGVERYFQIARCFRDEDQRGDRQPEFTQLDMETSFFSQEDILQLMEKMTIELVEKQFPHLTIQEKPFPRLTYKEAIDKYQSDKPDLRKDKDSKSLAFCWVVDFPMFEKSESENKIVAVHHPFTRPLDEDLNLMDKEPLKVRANAYDLVLNGFEIGGGSLRIFERELQKKVFKILGLSDEETQSRFGHMLEAFTFAPPPHGGIALGLDRLIMLLSGEENIREVMAFPKTGDARDLMMGAPSPMPESALKEAHIKLK
ncbi:MAG: aspartate--tRNA ligase [Candidatus Magasanikbacteria bacterium CG10_big_fil_rev_8_21_14_0_10_36_32]|uniref:Aspartate--tRNA ligase n=1 Tax=Candidatus Magasanikbacteria bacterium CG10_big_fil_rev_8_21_14_0_10_36_32 TaxID=1974646 RepID=A0A2M6W696_9BACT|nr:MAG: aspartate--tRNA ligase [Candidatus Magasanikbacteria bacterium CG10_big_fil_rev_8_21_14_0_10_36_32]